MIIGFTGTREGMTDPQVVRLANWVGESGGGEFHHGACVGADSHAADIADTFNLKVVAYPCTVTGMVCQEAVRVSVEIRTAKPPLDRNRDIVDACDILLVCPKGMQEEQRSGTWATVRYARRQGRRIMIFWPDGTITGG